METTTTSLPRLSSTGSAWIEPAIATEPRLIRCSAIENLCARVYPTPALFWPLENDDDATVWYQYMCRSLSRVLVQQPHLAGFMRQDARGAFDIEIKSAPQQGTRFYYADLSRDHTFPTFEEFAQAGFPFADGNADGLSRLRPDPFPQHEDGSPVITPQLTHLKGGLILNISFTHIAGDLLQLREFCNTWAAETTEVARAALEGRQEVPPPCPWPSEMTDKSRLIPDIPGPATMEELRGLSKAVPKYQLVDPTDPVALEAMQNIVPRAHIPACVSSPEEELRTTVSSVWLFPMAALKRVQSAAQAARPDVKLSTMDCLTAFLWARFFAAKYVSDSDLERAPARSELVYAGDVRRRMSPPMHPSYMGACVDLFRVQASSTTLLGSSSDDIATLGSAIRQSNGEWSEEEYMALLSLSQRTPLSPGFVPRASIDLLVTDHTRVASVTTADWGPGLGACTAYREPYIGRTPPAGELTMLPRRSNGDIEVMISGEKITLLRLAKDEEMKKASKRLFITHDVPEEILKRRMRRVKL